MNRKHVLSLLLFAVVVAAAPVLRAQIAPIAIEAGSPADKALQVINEEKDLAKRADMLKDFVHKFAGNAPAVAYGYSQLAQLSQANGDLNQALAYGDKALEAIPNNLEILVSQATMAQQAKQYSRCVDYATRGAKAVNGISGARSDAVQQSYEYLEATAINAISGESAPKQMLADVEKFDTAFPKSRLQEQAAQYAMIALQQMNDMSRLIAFGEKALATDPDNLPLMTLMANALAEDPKGAYVNRSIEFARKAIALAKSQPGIENDPSRRLSVGLAHSALGYALLKQEQTAAAIPELKTASGMVERDPAAYSTVLYRLGFAYAKLRRYTEAKEVLAKAVGIEGPFQQPSRDLLSKVNAAVKK